MAFNPDSEFVHASIFLFDNKFTTLNFRVSKMKVVDKGKVARIGLMKL